MYIGGAMKKPRFTLEMHIQTAQELLDAREEATALFLEISKAYPLNSKAARRAQAVLTAIDALRNELENCVYRETRKDHFLELLLGGG